MDHDRTREPFAGSSHPSATLERVNFAGRIDFDSGALGEHRPSVRSRVNSAQLDRSCEPPRGRDPGIGSEERMPEEGGTGGIRAA